jgi:hypothetical protein
VYYTEAINRIDNKLRADVHYKIDGTLDQIVWDDVAYKAVHGENQVHPSVADIEAMHTTVKVEMDALAYQGKRRDEYPPIEDQLDMIYHAGLGGDEFQEAIKIVKNKYPK